MVNKVKVCQNQKLAEEPSFEQIPLGRYGIVVDGKNLPSSITEDVGGVSLCPSYSDKQLREIKRRIKTKLMSQHFRTKGLSEVTGGTKGFWQ